MSVVIKNGDYVIHRSLGNAPYVTIGRVIDGGQGRSSHLRVMPVVRVFAFGSDHENWALTNKSETELFLSSECQFLWEDNRIPRPTEEEKTEYAKQIGKQLIRAGTLAIDARNRGKL